MREIIGSSSKKPNKETHSNKNHEESKTVTWVAGDWWNWWNGFIRCKLNRETGHLTITATDNSKDTRIYDIFESPFKKRLYRLEIKSVSFAGNIISIGRGAFRLCKSLKSVEMPKVKTIENYAFKNCRSLLRIDLSSAKEIQDYAFCDCLSLIEIIPPSKEELKHIGDGVFAKCSSLFGKCIQAIGPYDKLIKDEEDGVLAKWLSPLGKCIQAIGPYDKLTKEEEE